MERFIWPITVIIASILAPATGVLVWQATNTVVGPVDPTPTPAPVAAYAELVRQACKDLTGDERSYVASQYAALRAITLCDKQPKDDGEYQELLESVREDYYGTAYPFKDSLATLTNVAVAEATKRGLLAANGEATPWDSEGWRQFATDTLVALEVMPQ